jgi:hypothetical protein
MGAKSLLSVNTKVACIGGKRYVPVNVTVTGGNTYDFDWSKADTDKLPDYFRLDLNINMKNNFKRFSAEWFAEVTNITNHRNVWQKYYNASRREEEYIYQYGIFPVGGCRVYF